MTEPFERLREARIHARFDSAPEAARAMGVEVPTYAHHENGTRGFARHAARYARFFRVSLDWLLTGRGDMRRHTRGIPVHGLVGAGARVEMIEAAGGEPPDWIDLPEPGEIAALVVKGDSQLPRFREGEIVLFDPRPVEPASLIGQYAIVQKISGEQQIKILRRGLGDNLWRLESHNHEPEEDVRLIGAWRYLGTLSPPSLRAMPAQPRAGSRNTPRKPLSGAALLALQALQVAGAPTAAPERERRDAPRGGRASRK